MKKYRRKSQNQEPFFLARIPRPPPSPLVAQLTGDEAFKELFPAAKSRGARFLFSSGLDLKTASCISLLSDRKTKGEL